MRVVKYCKSEHNIADGCPTLQLGTFDYYRDMDQSFSIADAQEGVIEYHGPEQPLTVGAAEFNAITGGALALYDAKTQARVAPVPGSVNFEISGGETVWGEDGVVRTTLNDSLRVKLFYPNSYIFCAALLGDDEEPDPSALSEEYDSSYQIADIGEFTKQVGQLLLSQATMSDLHFDGRVDKEPIQNFGWNLSWQGQVKEVEYVPDRVIHLNAIEDFQSNHYLDLYASSIFQKDESYANDQEMRFVFLLRQGDGQILSMKPDPLLIDLGGLSSTTRPL